MQVGRKSSLALHFSQLAMSCCALLCMLFLPVTLLAKDFAFTWSANPEPVEGYRLYYKMGGEAGPPFDGTLATEGVSPVAVGKVTSFTLHGLMENTTYHFALTAYNGTVESAYSTIVSVDGQQVEPDPPPGPDPPADPGDGNASYSFAWSPNPEPVEGYRFYYKKGGEAGPLFDGSDANEGVSAIDLGKVTSYTISGLAENSTYHFATTAYNGSTESDYSAVVTVFGEGMTLLAVITNSSLSGEAPHTVHFDAGSSSGEITGYSWAFGDGDTASGSTVSNQFALPGNYSTTLTIHGPGGEEHQAMVQVTVTSPQTPPPPAVAPIAVISSSAAVDDAPLFVEFDGNGSTTEQPPMTSFIWAFGDGTTGSGAVTSHTYTTPGIYTATLTVTDSVGLSGHNSTPILVNEAPPVINEPPVASFSSSVKLGTPPLTVMFNAGASNDPDGSIGAYLWSFGDGGAATGVYVQHTFIQVGVFTVTLTVTDDLGLSTATTGTVTLVTEEEYQEILAARGAALIGVLQLLLSEDE